MRINNKLLYLTIWTILRHDNQTATGCILSRPQDLSTSTWNFVVLDLAHCEVLPILSSSKPCSWLSYRVLDLCWVCWYSINYPLSMVCTIDHVSKPCLLSTLGFGSLRSVYRPLSTRSLVPLRSVWFCLHVCLVVFLSHCIICQTFLYHTGSRCLDCKWTTFIVWNKTLHTLTNFSIVFGLRPYV